MDQSLVAGVGNIYRAEILYKVRVRLLVFLGEEGLKGASELLFLGYPAVHAAVMGAFGATTPGALTGRTRSPPLSQKQRKQARVHPEQPACSLDRPAFDRVWAHSVDLMQRGFLSGAWVVVAEGWGLGLGALARSIAAACRATPPLPAARP